jgi:hypothetical protein
MTNTQNASTITAKIYAEYVESGMTVTQKNVGKMVVQMYAHKNGGAMIVVWEAATADDVEAAETLPHIYQLSDDKKFNKFAEWHYAYAENARETYKHTLTSESKIVHFGYENM